MSRKTGKRTILRPWRDVTEQLDPFPAKTRPHNKNGAIFKPSLNHRKSRIQPNQKIFSLEHFRKKVDLFRTKKKSTVRCTLRWLYANRRTLWCMAFRESLAGHHHNSSVILSLACFIRLQVYVTVTSTLKYEYKANYQLFVSVLQ